MHHHRVSYCHNIVALMLIFIMFLKEFCFLILCNKLDINQFLSQLKQCCIQNTATVVLEYLVFFLYSLLSTLCTLWLVCFIKHWISELWKKIFHCEWTMAGIGNCRSTLYFVTCYFSRGGAKVCVSSFCIFLVHFSIAFIFSWL